MRPITGCCNGSSPPTHKTGAVVCATMLAGIFMTAASGSDSASISFWSEANAVGERCRIIGASRPLTSAPDTLPRSRSRLSRRGNFIRALETAAQAELFRAEFDGAEFFRRARLVDRFAVTHSVVKARQRINRERVAVEVVFQIKNAGKTSAGEVVFFPRAVFILLLHQIFRSPGNRRIARIGGCQQTDQAPCDLRSRAVALPLRRLHMITAQRFDIAGVPSLLGLQPRHPA